MKNSTPDRAPSRPPGGPPSRPEWQLVAIGALIGLAIGLTLGTAGAVKLYYDAKSFHGAVVQGLADDVTTAQQATDAANETIAEWERRAAGLSARIAVARAVDQLDQRNFGIAQTEVGAARELLERADAPVQTAGADLAQVDMRVAEDVGVQRAALIAISTRLDAALSQ